MNSLDHFTDRETAVAAFDRLWQTPNLWVLAFTGFSGQGKSTLLDWLEANRCLAGELPYALIGMGEYAGQIRAALHAMLETPTGSLSRHLPPVVLQRYRQKRAATLADRNRRQLTLVQQQTMQGSPQGEQQLSANLAEAYRAMDAQADEAIFDAWLECVEALPTGLRPVLLLDNYDTFQDAAAIEELQRFWQVLERARARVPNLRVVLASREPIRHQDDVRALHNGLVDDTLQPLTAGDSDALLASLGVNDAGYRRAVFAHLAQGHPLLTRMAAEAWLEAGGSLGAQDIPRQINREQAVEWVQGRILDRLSGPTKDAVRWAALLRWFQADSLAWILEGALTVDEFRRLTRYAFIIRPRLAPQAWACHDLVRRVQMAHLQQERPDAFRSFHQKARDYWHGRGDALEALYHDFFLDSEAAFAAWQEMEGMVAHDFDHATWSTLVEMALAPELNLPPDMLAHVQYRAGRRHYYRAEWVQAVEQFDQALERFNAIGDRLGQANVLKAIGDVQQFRKDRDAALASYDQALERFNAIGDRLGQANVLKAIGDVQQFRKELDAALASYDQALERFNAIGSLLGQANVLMAIGDVQQFRDDRDPALASYDQALERFNAIGSLLGQANVQQSMGKLYMGQDNPDSVQRGLELLNQALAAYQTIGDRVGQTNIYTFLSRWLAAQGQIDEALGSGQQALELAESFIPDHSFSEWLRGFVQDLAAQAQANEHR
jgi:tetratricopeptide (TPR) repeat protein